jgi:hypothetical protein
MALGAPFPELDEFLFAIGEAGRRLAEIEAIEGAAGNISVYRGWPAHCTCRRAGRVNGSCPCATCRRASPLAAFHGERERLARSRIGRRAVCAGDERTGTDYRLCVAQEGERYAT